MRVFELLATASSEPVKEHPSELEFAENLLRKVLASPSKHLVFKRENTFVIVVPRTATQLDFWFWSTSTEPMESYRRRLDIYRIKRDSVNGLVYVSFVGAVRNIQFNFRPGSFAGQLRQVLDAIPRMFGARESSGPWKLVPVTQELVPTQEWDRNQGHF